MSYRSRLKRATRAFVGRIRSLRHDDLDGNGLDIDVREDDVFIVSYPRSGNTWIRFLLTSLITGKPATYESIAETVPDIYQTSKDQLERMCSTRILKSHEPVNDQYPRVIYVVRDPHDVVVSYYEYHIRVRKIADDYPLTDYVDDFLLGRLGRFGTWKDHVTGWLTATERGVPFLMIRYEDLSANPRGKLRSMAQFAGVTVSRLSLQRAVEASTATRMRQLEADNPLAADAVAVRSDRPFVRTARPGAGREALPSSSAKAIRRVLGDMLDRLGY